MAFERTQLFRLVERGGAGLACDADGISLGGIELTSADAGANGAGRYVVRSTGELGAILRAAYGTQREDVIRRCHRGLLRAAAALDAENLALAGIEAVMLGLPDLDADAMAKLTSLADLEKGGDAWRNEPRVPTGQPEGGQWTTGGSPPSTQPARKPRQPRSRGRSAHPTPARPRAHQSSPPIATGRPPSASVTNRPHEQSRSNDPLSAVVDFSNAVAGTLVDAAHWLEQPAAHVPIAPEIASGEPGFPMGTAWEETTDPGALRETRPVSHLEVALDAVGVVGAVAPGVRAAAEGAEVAGEVKRFSSLSALRRYLGPAGAGYQWHHIVEQTPANLRRFGPEAIHSTDNVVRVPTSVHIGKGSISADYSSKPAILNGLTVRQWLSTQSFQAQRDYGIRMLKRDGQWK